MLLLASCSSVQVSRSNKAITYAGLTGQGERRMEIAPSTRLPRNYRRVTVAPVSLLPKVTTSLSPTAAEGLKAVFHAQLCRQIIKRWGRDAVGNVGGDLLVLPRITYVKEVSPGLNIATAVVTGPLSNGQLAVEIEAVDVASGKQVALLLLADEADFRDIRRSFTPDGHARALASRFAIEAVEFIAPIIGPR
ncbi:DUF3313 family protein [Stenotrophomonas maltophilia]|nr:DUF3313 family protein [Stenotrophomonas maltophilia]